MKPSMIRWKTVPSYSGSVVFCRVSGCVHSRRPSARSAKLATVVGAWSGNRFTRMSPWFVCRTALRAGAVDSVTTSTLPRAPTGVIPHRCRGGSRYRPAHVVPSVAEIAALSRGGKAPKPGSGGWRFTGEGTRGPACARCHGGESPQSPAVPADFPRETSAGAGPAGEDTGVQQPDDVDPPLVAGP